MSEPETDLARALVKRFASIEQVRFTNSERGGPDGGAHGPSRDRPGTGCRLRRCLPRRPDDVPARQRSAARALRVHSSCPTTTPPLSRRSSPGTGELIACVLVEPMLGAGGCIPASRGGFLAVLRGLTEAHGALLVLDEVMTSRLAVGGAQAVYDVRADLTVLGKYFGGGLSFGAFGGLSPGDGGVRPDAGRAHARRHLQQQRLHHGRRAPPSSVLLDADTLAGAQRGVVNGFALTCHRSWHLSDSVCTGVGLDDDDPPHARPGGPVYRPRERRSLGGVACSSKRAARGGATTSPSAATWRSALR